MKVRNLVMGAALAALAFPSLASAGRASSYGVSIVSSGGLPYASGTVAGARRSADANQFIQCSSHSGYGWCEAVNAAGKQLTCYSLDAGVVASMESVTSNSAIYFSVNTDNTCNYVVVENGSAFLE